MQRPSESEVVDPRMMPTSFDQPRDPIDLKQAVWRWDPAHSVRSIVVCCVLLFVSNLFNLFIRCFKTRTRIEGRIAKRSTRYLHFATDRSSRRRGTAHRRLPGNPHRFLFMIKTKRKTLEFSHCFWFAKVVWSDRVRSTVSAAVA